MDVSYADMLTNAKVALDGIVTGRIESYTVSGPSGEQTFKRHNVSTLLAYIEWLQSRVDRSSNVTMTQSLSFGGTE